MRMTNIVLLGLMVMLQTYNAVTAPKAGLLFLLHMNLHFFIHMNTVSRIVLSIC